MNLFKTVIFSMFVSLIISGPCVAESSKPDLGALMPSAKNMQAKVVERSYHQMSYKTLYKLAFSHDAYSVYGDDPDVIQTYLMITECLLYNKFFENEFEWNKITKVTKKYLLENKNKAPKYYEFVQPIFLGRYDYALQGFPVITGDKDYKAQKNFQFASYPVGDTDCQKYSLDARKYPGAGVLSIQSPITLSFVRVPKNLAQKYVEWRLKQGITSDADRQAYIRYRFKIEGYDGIKSFGGVDAFNFRGKILRLDVFADKEMMLPLYNQLF